MQLEPDVTTAWLHKSPLDVTIVWLDILPLDVTTIN